MVSTFFRRGAEISPFRVSKNSPFRTPVKLSYHAHESTISNENGLNLKKIGIEQVNY